MNWAPDTMKLKFWEKSSSEEVQKSKPKTTKKSNLREWIDSIIFAIVAATLIRGLLVEPFTIPTSSMEKSLLVGDYLFVSKFHYGARTPKTLIQFPLAHQHFWGTGIPSYLDWIQLPQTRLPGFTHVKRGDAVVFNYPLEYQYPSDLKVHYIKRCMGLPGDVIEVRNLQVFIDGEAVPNPEFMQYRYQVVSDESIKDRVFRKYDITDFYAANDGYIIHTSPEVAETLKSLSFIKDVRPIHMSKDQVNSRIFPDAQIFPWNEDFFGPLKIPYEGMIIKITPENLATYQSVITHYEGHDEVSIRDGKLFLEGIEVNEYQFKQDYYFMMGDNRHNSEDSRFWGFVPEDHIVGKALFIWFSLDPNAGLLEKVRWDRLFNLIH